VKKIVIIFVATTFSLFSYASCDFEKTPEGYYVQRTSRGTVYGFFSSHTTNHGDVVVNRISNSNNSEDMALNLKSLIGTHSVFLEEKKNEISQIRGMLRSKNIRWYGTENSVEERGMAQANEEIFVEYDRIKRELREGLEVLPNWNKSDSESILVMFFPTYIIAGAEERARFQNAREVPLDPDAEKKRSFELIREIETQRENLIKSVQEGGFTRESLTVLEALSANAIRSDVRISSEQISTLMNTKFQNASHEARQEVRAFIDKHNSFLELSDARDVVAAQRGSQQVGNGIIVMGTAHGPGIMNKMTEMCNEELSQSGNNSLGTDSIR